MQTQDRLAESASMRTALLVYSGITREDDDRLGPGCRPLDNVHGSVQRGGFAGAHDHPLEEAYLILEGEVEGSVRRRVLRLSPGDLAWAGVGCVHQFRNIGDGPVRWLETQAPQPPPRHSYRFARDWSYLESALVAEAEAGR